MSQFTIPPSSAQLFPPQSSGSSENDITRPRKRRRPALACFECRRRKVKCDRNNPCNPCIQAKCTSCVYDPRTAASHGNHYYDPRQPVPPDQPGAADSGRLTIPINNFPTPSSSPRTGSLTDASHSNAEQSSRRILSAPDKTTEQLLQRIHDLERKLSDSQELIAKCSGTVDAAKDVQLPSSSLPTSAAPTQCMRGSLSKTRMFGQSHWMGHFQQFQGISPFDFWNFNSASFVEHERFKEVCALLDKCKRLGRATKAQRPSRWLIPSEPEFKNFVPHRDRADKLVDAYFRCFESTYRILHVPSFRHEYVQYWENPESASIGFVVKLFLILAIGASIHQDVDGSTQDLSDVLRWVYAAQNWLSAPFEKSRLNLTGLQIYCLLLIARQNVSVAPDLVWISAGSLLRTAMQMGLHRDPRNFPKMSVLHMEIRRRLWATILEISVQSALDSGMPPMISLSDFDTDPPSNIDDNDIDETTLLSPISQPESVFTQTSIQIALLESLQTRLEVARVANDSRFEPSYDTILELSSEVQSACRKSNSLFNTTSQKESAPTAFHRNLMDFHLRRFLLTLHHPFAFKSTKDPRFYFSRKICFETSLNLSCPEPSKDFFNLMAIGGGLYRALSTHCSLTFWFEIITQQEDDKLNGTFDRTRNSANMSPIRKACKNLLEILDARLLHGETNVKGQMFMNMVLGQIDAVENGTSQEDAIFESATKAVRSCYDTLKLKLHSSSQGLEAHENEKQQGVEGVRAEIQDFGFGFLQDGGLPMDFEFPDSLLFSHDWDEDSWVV